jgi:hypothetical protein
MPQKESLYITWQWHMLNEDEVAQTGVHVSVDSGIYHALTELEALDSGSLTALDTAMFKLMSVSSLAFAPWGVYTGLKVAALGTDGKYLGEPKTFVRVTPKPGAGPGYPSPQQSIVASLLGANPAAPGSRGRMYLPYTGPNSSSSGSPRIPAGLTPSMATGVAAFIKDVNAAVDVAGSNPQRVAIVSQQPASASPYTTKQVVSVRVGDIVDTQRRRRNKMVENYASATVPTS